jgi:hypothetical protein
MGGVSVYIANLLDKLDTRRFWGLFSLGVHAGRKDSYFAQCVAKDWQTPVLCGHNTIPIVLN